MSKARLGPLAQLALLVPLALAGSVVLLAMLEEWVHQERRARQARREPPARPAPSAPRAIRDRLAQPDRGVPLARQEYPEPPVSREQRGHRASAELLARAGFPEHLARKVNEGL
ncbi:MAG TPA: hypothetical protein VIX41_11475 [Acidimicrobiales bacterium]